VAARAVICSLPGLPDDFARSSCRRGLAVDKQAHFDAPHASHGPVPPRRRCTAATDWTGWTEGLNDLSGPRTHGGPSGQREVIAPCIDLI